MLQGLLSGLVNTEKITNDTIQEALENISNELDCSYKELFIKIATSEESFTPSFHIFKTEICENLETIPRYRFIREITLKEILGNE